MNKVALNFICKNEAHIVERMMKSVLPVIDMIVAVDTGSTDNTIDIIKKFGLKNNLPTYIHERPFDNFSNSRNHALDMLKKHASNAGWDLGRSWGFTVDCDEWIKIDPAFKKESLEADYYVIRQRIGRETFTRHGLYRLSKEIYWESPIHETLAYTDPTIVKKYEFKIEVVEEQVGFSWKGDLVAKFMNYAKMLQDHLDQGNENFRTVYFLGDSYNAAGSHCKDKEQALHYYKKAQSYFDWAATLEARNMEVRFMLFKKIAENRQAIGEPWCIVKQNYIQAFLEYPAKAETFALVIEHYIDEKNWELAYYYSKFSYNHFVCKSLGEKRILYNDESLYRWRLLFCVYITAYHSGRKEEAFASFKMLKHILKTHPEYFFEEDLILIKIHTPTVMKIRRWTEIGKSFISAFMPGRSKTNLTKEILPAAPKKIHYAA